MTKNHLRVVFFLTALLSMILNSCEDSPTGSSNGAVKNSTVPAGTYMVTEVSGTGIDEMSMSGTIQSIDTFSLSEGFETNSSIMQFTNDSIIFFEKNSDSSYTERGAIDASITIFSNSPDTIALKKLSEEQGFDMTIQEFNILDNSSSLSGNTLTMNIRYRTRYSLSAKNQDGASYDYLFISNFIMYAEKYYGALPPEDWPQNIVDVSDSNNQKRSMSDKSEKPLFYRNIYKGRVWYPIIPDNSLR